MEQVPSDAELKGLPFSEEQYEDLAERYRETGGRAPSADERATDQAALAASTLPQRRINQLRARPGAVARSGKILAEMTEADQAHTTD